MWLILRLKLSCFSHQGFLGGGGGGGEGGSWYFAHGCGLCNEGGGQGKNTPNNRGGFQKMHGKNLKSP